MGTHSTLPHPATSPPSPSFFILLGSSPDRVRWDDWKGGKWLADTGIHSSLLSSLLSFFFLFLHLSLASRPERRGSISKRWERRQRGSVRDGAVAWTVITRCNISQSPPLFFILSGSGVPLLCLPFKKKSLVQANNSSQSPHLPDSSPRFSSSAHLYAPPPPTFISHARK